jgi:hypothetical protein
MFRFERCLQSEQQNSQRGPPLERKNGEVMQVVSHNQLVKNPYFTQNGPQVLTCRIDVNGAASRHLARAHG